MTSFQDQPPQSRRALRQERAQSQEIDDSAAADVRPSGRRARAAAAGDDTQITGDLPVLVEPGTVAETDLIVFARERLAGFETPKSIVFVEALPETVGGKVMKYKLREQFA